MGEKERERERHETEGIRGRHRDERIRMIPGRQTKGDCSRRKNVDDKGRHIEEDFVSLQER